MSEELALLYQVQQVDTELARLKADLAKLNTGLELKTEVGVAEAEHKSLQGELHGAEAEARALELEVKTLQEKKPNSSLSRRLSASPAQSMVTNGPAGRVPL